MTSLVAALALAGCGAPQPEPPPPPEVVFMPGGAVGDFLARQRISGVFAGRSVEFEAALQKEGDRLTVIGLTPYGTKAFVLVQDGLEVAFTSYMPPEKREAMPLEPAYLLADIHHAYFIRADPSAAGAAGWRPADHGAEFVFEDDREGVRLRSFRRSLTSDRQVRVQHRGSIGPDGFPRHVHLDNGYYGYTLDIETLSYQPLE